MSAVGFFLVLLTAALTMGANLLLRAGIDSAGGFAPSSASTMLTGLINLFSQPLFTVGFVSYALASVVWFRVVATEPLSVAYPILVSVTFLLVTAGAVVFFSEPLSVRKVLGLLIILFGIAVISLKTGGP
jgi:undecaprenyl phosphate-alpha-L-ara4N flippase subunit ArnE